VQVVAFATDAQDSVYVAPVLDIPLCEPSEIYSVLIIVKLGAGAGVPLTLKVAVAFLFDDITKLQELVPEQSPVQPENTEPTSGLVDRVTLAPSENDALQVPVLQLFIPDGEDDTEPEPAPEIVTARLLFTPEEGVRLKTVCICEALNA
jgi:hypothetical protein